jgi:hypothetical protein
MRTSPQFYSSWHLPLSGSPRSRSKRQPIGGGERSASPRLKPKLVRMLTAIAREAIRIADNAAGSLAARRTP